MAVRYAAVITLLFSLSAAPHQTVTVTTFEELEASLSDGADILINADITFTDTLTIAGDVGVTMRSTIGAVLDAAGVRRHMQIEGALTASGLTFQVSRRSAPPDHIRPARFKEIALFR